jgi:hypothetical protein
MTTWISAPDAFAIVVSHEVAPDVAYEKILAAIKDKKLPARARMVNFYDDEDDEVEVLPISFWEVTDPSINFEEATARSINIAEGYSFIENVRDLEFSERHLFDLWPKPAKPSQSMKSRAKLANVPQKTRGRKGKNVTQGIIDRMKVMSRTALEAMNDEEMVATFGGVRSTCQTARKIALAKMSGE